MWRRDKWHKFTASILALAMLLTMLAVPTASAEEEVRTVAVTDEEGQEVTDVATEKDDTEAIEQEQTDTETNSSEMTDDEGIPTEEDSSQIDETGSEITNTPDSADKEESDTEMTPLPSTENSVSTETSNHSDKKDSKDSDITEQSTTEQSDKQEQFVLKGTVTLEELTGENVPWKYILVRLYDADTYDENAENHTYIAESQTRTNGTYTFDDVEPGNYRIEFISRNKLYEDISCKWKEPANGQKKIYTVEITRQKIGLDEENKEDNREGNEEEQEEPEEYFAFIKNIKLPQEDLLRMEQDDSDTYVEVNLELVETRQEEESEDQEEEKQEEEEAIESENDSSDMMSIEDLKDIDEDIVAATMEKQEPSEIQTMDVNGGTWSFDAYYLNENDRHDVTKTNDFHLKYQVEFHTNNQVIAAGNVEIRIKKTLFDREYDILKKRNYSGPIDPTEIAVPSGKPGSPTESESTPFNYYEELIGKDTYLVFFNYKAIEAGTNIAFQVLYRNVEVMYIEDGTDWSLKPTIIVKGSEPEDGKLNGRVDTGVTLTSVTKTPYDDVGKRYTPGLYTEAQVQKYIGKELPQEYAGENFNKYRYVIWEVEVKGTATQPWDIDVREHPGQEGQVLGYCVGDTTATNGTPVPGQPLPDNKDANGYVRLTNESNMKEGQFDRRQRYTVQNVEGSDSYVFYVVVAYPKEEVDKDSLLENNIDVRLSPLDGLEEGEEPEEKTATAKWNYINYTWSYKGDNYELSKEASATKYEGWMEIYKNAKKNGETVNLPALDFHIKGDVTGYGLTHLIKEENGEKYSEVIEGASYSVSVIDDVLYAFSMEDNRKYHILDGTDYYYSAVSISLNDYEYDFYEDEYITPEDAGTLEIYAMFAKGEGATTDLTSKTWTKVEPEDVKWDSSGMTCTFSSGLLAREPWRVKAVHNTTNYETECSINVSVRLRQESEKLAALISDNTQSIKILNLAGMMVEQFVPEEGTDEIIRKIVNATKDDDLQEGLYGEPGLMDLTKALYEDVLIQRNNAETQLCGLEKDACAYKSSTIQTNDPNNSRTQVTYQISAYDGYKVQSEAMVNDLKNLGVTSPGRNKVVFYDLLPYGMHFDPSYQVKVRRINGPAQARWDKTDDRQLIVTTDIKDNYEGTGRTLVAFHIKYTGGDSASFYKAEGANSGHWKEHFGVEFRAYYSWKDITVVDAGVNACAFMSEEDPNRSFLGKESQVATDNGKVVPQDLENVCKDFGKDIDKDGDYDESVLYASVATTTNAAVATSTEIKKLVRADYDMSGEYQKSAVVAPGEGYTYDITVSTNDNTSIQNLVVFDRLENDKNSEWKGTFDSVIKYGLELLGVQPVIYYHAKSDAPIPTNEPDTGNIKEKPDSAWLTSKGWVRAEQWNPELEVKAVAVDFGNFQLNGGKSVNFRIKMKAPTEGMENNAYTYNNVSYYSVPTNSSDVGTIASGNSTTVKLYGMDELEVVKEFGEGVPAEKEKTSFVFNLTEKVKEGEEPIKFAYKEYQLWKKNESSGKWEYQNDGKNYGTDAEGRLFLHAGEKAVFQLANAEHIYVEEQENPYWEVEKSKDETIKRTDTIDLRTVIFTNTYRPILYVKKVVSGNSVPQGEDISGKTFTFRMYADGEPLANSEFWYFKDIRTDGGIPNRVEASDGSGYKTGTTNGNGEFTISANDIVGLFPGKIGTQYKVVEILKTGDEAEWICEDTTAEGTTVEKNVINGGTEEENIVEGTMVLNGSSVTFTNLYTRKELRITKRITHQDPGDYQGQSFEFQIWDATKSAGGEPAYVSGNPWAELDSSGKVTTNGILGSDGKFTCKADHTVKISGLQAGHTYVIKETASGQYYVPEQDTQEVTMPEYANSDSVTFVNNYQWRSLTVTKQVAVSDASKLTAMNNERFTMVVEKKEKGSTESQLLTGFEYVITPKSGAPITGQTNSSGEFTIKNGESVFFKNIGIKGDEITVTEKLGTDAEYQCVYPAEGYYKKILDDTECQMNFVNGEENNLVVINDVVAKDAGAEELLREMTNMSSFRPPSSPLSPTEGSNRYSINLPPYFQFDFSLNIDPSGGQDNVLVATNQLFSYWNYDSYNKRYVEGNSTTYLYPGDIIVIPTSTGQDSYEVTMNKTFRNFVWCWDRQDGPIYVGRRWFEFSLIEPENDGTIAGTMADNPVATFVTEVREITFEGSKIEKRMVPGSNAVPKGSKLVWRLERYNGSTWEPAQGVSYAVMDETGYPDADGIQSTGADGRITLIKNAVTYPVVQFQKDTVYLNCYGNASPGDLRLVELMEESDKEWGRLAGYGNEAGEYSLSMSSEEAVAIVNSNRVTSMRIAKEMETTSDESFTMYLRQVLSASTDSINNKTDIIESVAGAGIPYILYDSRTNKETGRGTTGAKGEILIKAGEYATLYLPDKTVWTVEEDIKVNYKLEKLNGTPTESEEQEKVMTALGDNLMLVYLRAESTDFGMLKAKFINPENGYHYVMNNFYNNPYTYLSDSANYVVELYDSSGKYVTTLDVSDFQVDLKSSLPYDENSLTYSGYLQIPIWGQGKYADLSTIVTVPIVALNDLCSISTPYDLDNYHLKIDNGNLEIPYIVKYKGRKDALRIVTEVSNLSDCNGLEHLVIGDGITSVHSLSIPSLLSLEIPGSITNSSAWTNSCPNLERVVINKGVTSIPNGSFRGCTKLTNITIPDSVTSIGTIYSGNGVFEGCTRLKNITIPDSVTTIGQSAFKGCTELESITIPDSVTTIGQNAFEGCTGLKNITIPDKVTSINASAFKGCIGLTNIVIPDSVTTISSDAFKGCTGLTDVILPDSVTVIGGNAFTDCTNLRSITLGRVESLTNIVGGCKSLTEITIPSSVRSINGLFNNSYIETVIFENGNWMIPSGAFRECTNIKKIVIPNSVTFIPDRTFEGCSSLTEIDIDKDYNETNSSLFNSTGLDLEKVTIYWKDGTVTGKTP